MKDYSHLYSDVVKRAKASVIRELLKMTGDPEIISFAGGLPDPTAFPYEKVQEVFCEVLKNDGKRALQYGATEGSHKLKAQLVKWLKAEEDIDLEDKNIIITSASQQALDMVGRIFINPGDHIVVTNPSYLGALQAFNSCAAAMVGADTDDDGVIPESLEACLAKLKAEGKVCKFVYLIPDFQNPTGTTIGQDRRVKILEIIKKYNTILIEDSPYRQVRFEGTAPDTFYKLDKGEGNVITLFTFSKTFVPGFRLGYVAGDENVIRQFTILKQSMDLCTPEVLQLATAKYMEKGYLKTHINHVVAIYKEKLGIMLGCLEEYMPKGVKWTRPQGGLFLWVEVPANIDTEKMFPTAIKNKVAYVIGSAFYYDGNVKNNMRLNFSYATHDEIREGIKRLAATIKDSM
ncbi:2-aminoadipate transaminase [Elusimicrobium simillimum]|uniref:aminotransferase-like domain-containing protein n=1 Tax=Elusimicrobium simillimum TaxID=3143438 RepID=UPI003C6EF4F9